MLENSFFFFQWETRFLIISFFYETCLSFNGYRRRKMDIADRVRILVMAVCISHNHGKGMNRIILPSVMDK